MSNFMHLLDLFHQFFNFYFFPFVISITKFFSSLFCINTNLWVGLLPIIHQMKCAGRDLESFETNENLQEHLQSGAVEASIDGM